jgi:hypothetical protein
MANVQSCITPELEAFIIAQPMFFVGTAPLSPAGHINVSPKGLATFRVISPTRVAYLDLTGSGNETAAHVLENGRITFMFCAFEASPKILRLYGTAKSVTPGGLQWDELAALFPTFPGVRQIFDATIERVQTSCGFGVPVMQMVGQRDTLPQWAQKKGPEGIKEYQQNKNRISIDGLRTDPADSQ